MNLMSLFRSFRGRDFMDGVITKRGNQKFVGELEVFDQQIEAANTCFDIFTNGNELYQSPILLGECQSGKTGSAVILIKCFINWCDSRGIRKNERKIYFGINSSNNDLLDQLRERLFQSGLTEQVIEFHHSKYRALNPNPNDKARLIIVDECHVALCNGDLDNLKPYENFLNKCGIELDKHRNYWNNKNNFLLQISATPNAQLMHNGLKELYGDTGPFKFVYLKNAETYLSVTNMFSNGRIQQAHKIISSVNKGEVTPWFAEKLLEFYNLTKSEHGVLLIRITGDDKIRNLVKHIKKNYPNQFEIRDYNSKNKNIGNISKEIAMRIPKPLIGIVRGSLREGKTLDSTKYIKMIIETADTVSSSAIQGLLGRCCGYPISNHNRHGDTFKIYCDVEEVKDHVKMLEDLRQGKSPSSIASSRYNDSSINAQEYAYRVDILPFCSAESLILERNENLKKYADSKEYYDLLIAKHSDEYQNGLTIDDCDTYVASKILKFKSITAQHTNRKSKLVSELVESFEQTHYDEGINRFRVNRGAKVSKYLNYEILDGSLPEQAELYANLFSILNKHLNLDIDQKYVIFYTDDRLKNVTTDISVDKLKPGLFNKKSIAI